MFDRFATFVVVTYFLTVPGLIFLFSYGGYAEGTSAMGGDSHDTGPAYFQKVTNFPFADDAQSHMGRIMDVLFWALFPAALAGGISLLCPVRRTKSPLE